MKLSKEEHDKIIRAKVGSFMVSSPIDTWRQNNLVSKALTPRKIARSLVSSCIASTMISIPCHYSMLQMDKFQMNRMLSFAVGIMAANLFKVPAVFYHKRCQVGASLCARMPAEMWKNVLKLSVVEDFIEEGVKNHFSKCNLESRDKVKREIVILQAASLFILAYPFDIFKNKFYYDTAIKFSKSDFAKKALYKNVQNIAFLSLIQA